MSRRVCIILVTALSLLLAATFGFAQDIFTISGKVLKADGTPAVGYQVKVSNESRSMTLEEGVLTTATTDAEGEYTIALTGDAVVEAGDTFKAEVIDPDTGDILGYSTESVTDANFEFQGFGLKIGSITLDVRLPGITALITPKELKAGVDTKADVSVTVLDQTGNPITDDTVTLEILQGGGEVVSPASFQDDAYKSTYTAPTPALEGTVKIKITSAKLNQSITATLSIIPGPAETVLVEPVKSKLPIPDPGQSAETDVIITVKDSQGNLVKGETVTVSSIFEGQTEDLGQAEDQGDGTYKITFSTTSTNAGLVTLEATTSNGKKGSAEITLTAQAPASVTLTAQPTEIAAGSSDVITVIAIVKDKMGNVVPEESIKFELVSDLTDPGALSAEEAVSDTDGKCQVSYTPGTIAGTVKVKATAESTKVYGEVELTVKAGTAAEVLVQVLPETGIVADGSQKATVVVTVKDSYGNLVSDEKVKLAVEEGGQGTVTEYAEYDEAKGAYVGTYTSPALALEEGQEAEEMVIATAQNAGLSGSAAVKLLGTPPKSTPVLTITGTVYYADGVTPAPEGWLVKIENLRLGPQDYLTPVEPVETNSGGTYNVVLLALENVAQTGDVLEATVTVSADGETIFQGTRTLTGDEIESTQVEWDITTNKIVETNVFSISGTVYYADGTVASGWEVSIANKDIEGISAVLTSNGSGRYDQVFLEPEKVVAKTNDTLEITVKHPKTGEVVGTLEHKVTTAEVLGGHADVDVTIDAIRVLRIAGTVYEGDGVTPVEAGLSVNAKAITAEEKGRALQIVSPGETDENGAYEINLIDDNFVAAIAGDLIELTVRKDGETVGGMEYAVNAEDLKAGVAKVDIILDSEPPVASAEADIVAAGIGEEITFDASKSTDNIGIKSYTWDFGDGTSGEGVTVKHAYDKPGIYTVKLSVADFAGNVGTAEIEITVGGLIITATVYEGDGKTLLPDGLALAVVSISGKPDLTKSEAIVGGSIKVVYDKPEADQIAVGDELSLKVVSAKDGETLYADEIKWTITEAEKTTALLALGDIVTYHTSEFRVEGVITDVKGKPISGATVADESRGISATSGDDGRYALLYTDYDTNPIEGEEITLKVTVKGFSRMVLVTAELADRMVIADVQVAPISIGGLAINSSYYTRSIYAIVQDLTSQISGIGPFIPLLISQILSEGYYVDPFTGKKQVVITPPVLPTFPDGPQLLKEIAGLDMETFGNAILPSPLGGVFDLEVIAGRKGVEAKVAGNKLDLYISVPYPGVEDVAPSLVGVTNVTPKAIEQVVDSFDYQFQLDEEMALLVLPWWPGSDLAGKPAFESVTLYYADADANSLDAPVNRTDYNQVTMSPERVGDTYVWKADVKLTPGKRYYYFYEVHISPSVKLPILGMDIFKWSMPDPRNLQFDDRGLVNKVIGAIKGDLVGIINSEMAIYGPTFLDKLGTDTAYQAELIAKISEAVKPKVQKAIGEIIAQMQKESDPMIVSFFTVPDRPADGSLWVVHFDVSPNVVPDGRYELQLKLSGPAGVMDEIKGKTLTLDRSAASPQGMNLALDPGRNAGLYRRDDGVYVAAAKEEIATIKLTATYTATDAVGALIQVLNYSDDPEKQASMPWMPVNSEFVMGYVVLQHLSDELKKELTENPTLETLMKVMDELMANRDKIWEDLKKLDPDAISAIEKALSPEDQIALAKIQELLIGLMTGKLDMSELMDLVQSGMFSNLQKMIGMLTYFSISPLQLGPTGVYSTEVLLPVEGKFWLRAVPFDDILNMEVTAPVVRLDVVPFEFDRLEVVKASIGDINGDGDEDDPYESGDAEGFTIFSDVDKVKLTLKMVKRTAHPIISGMLQYAIVPAEGGEYVWKDAQELNAEELTALAEGDEYEVEWDINFDELVSPSMKIAVRAVATNALGAVDIAPKAVTMNLDKGVTPTPPEVIVIIVEAPEKNPDSGAPKGTVTLYAYTRLRTITDIKYVRFEISKDGGQTWEPLDENNGGVPNGVVEKFEQEEIVDPAIIQAAIEKILGGAKEVSLDKAYNKWTLAWDTTKVDDTIENKEPENRDATQDDNPYVIRAIAVDVNDAEQKKPATTKVSVDNIDDVPPITGTEIVKIEAQDDEGNFVEVAPDKNGVYRIAAGVRITAKPKADPKTFDKVILFVKLDDQVAAELEMTAAEDGTYLLEADSRELPNGVYTLQALAKDESNNLEEADPALAKTIKIANVWNPEGKKLEPVDVVNTLTSGKPVQRTLDKPKPIGGVAEFFMKAYNVSRAILEVTDSTGALIATVNGVIADSADDPDLKEITFTWDTTGLNGEFSLLFTLWGSPPVVVGPVSVVVDNIAPTLAFDAPASGTTVTTMPLIWTSYSDASGVKKLTFELEGPAGDVKLEFAPDDEPISGTNEIPDGDRAVLTVEPTRAIYKVLKPLTDGVYTAKATVEDLAGNETSTDVKFVIGEEKPPVVLAFGPQGVITNTKPKIYVSYTDDLSGVEKVVFKLDGKELANVQVAETTASVTPDAELSGGDHTVEVTLTDKAGKSTTFSWEFTVQTDLAAPIVTAYSPVGIVKTARPTVSVSFTDESKVAKVVFDVGGQKRTVSNPSGGTASFKPSTLKEGEVQVKVTVTDEYNNSATVAWSFTVVLDSVPPVVTAYSPTGVVRTARPTVNVSFVDESKVTKVVFDVGGQKRTVSNPSGGTASFKPSTLKEGEVQVKVTVTDEYNNSATVAWSFTVELDTLPPTVVAMNPTGLIGELKPMIVVSYTDDRSGVDKNSVTMYLDGKKVKAKATETQATYTPTSPISKGKHKVKIELADKVGNKTSQEWQFKLEENPPIITSYTPVDGEFVKAKASIVVSYADDLSGVDVKSVKMVLDGTDVTGELKKDAGRAAYVPAQELALGKHTVKIELADKIGNKTEREWEFYVEADGLKIQTPKVYPNPFNPTEGPAKIEFTITQTALVTVKIYDFSLRLVKTLADSEEMLPGLVELTWDGKTDGGDELAKGVYFCQIIVKPAADEPKVTVLKIALYR
jgi:PKD repeat protein